MPSQNGLSALRWLVIAAAVLLLDQLTKLWIMTDFVLGDSRYVSSFFNLVRAHNEGAAFSFLSDAGGWQRWFFTILSTVISLVIVVWLVRLPRQKILEAIALSLILGGALGNLYDRVTLGYVVDFLDFHWAGWHFAAFNVADMAISVGAGLIIIEALFFADTTVSEDKEPTKK
jgi:signal peptidase II